MVKQKSFLLLSFFPFNAHFLHFSFCLYFSNLSIFFLFYSSLSSFISFSPSFHFPFVPFFVSFLYSCISSVPSLAFRCFSLPPFILLSFVCPLPFPPSLLITGFYSASLRSNWSVRGPQSKMTDTLLCGVTGHHNVWQKEPRVWKM